MTVRIVKVIYCDEGRRGRGTAENMVRPIPSLYTLDGELICSHDVGGTSDGSEECQHVNFEALRKAGAS